MVKKIVKLAIQPVIPVLPLSTVRKLASANLFLPFYHIVSDENLPHVNQLFHYRDVNAFENELDFFLQHWKPIGLSDLLSYVNGEGDIPPNSMLLTFDDGFREIHDIVVPILKRKGVKAVFFLCSSALDNKQLLSRNKISLILEHSEHSSLSKAAIGEINTILKEYGHSGKKWEDGLKKLKSNNAEALDVIGDIIDVDFDAYLRTRAPYLSAEQVEDILDNGFEIGSHSIDHPLYEGLDLPEQLRQTKESTQVIKSTFNLGYGAFAFPFNDYGVSKHFFDQIYRDGLVDITFGSGWGLKEEKCSRHFQRVSFERESAPAESIVRELFQGRIQDRITGNLMIKRS